MFKKLSLLTAGLLLSLSAFATDVQSLIQKANSGDIQAQSDLSHYYHFKKDYKNQFYWAEKLAKTNNPVYQFEFGLLYYYGFGVKQDHHKAIEWFTKSANQNFSDAQYYLGVIYDSKHFVGVQQDYKKSLEWLTKSANQNHTEAQMLLGLKYEYGMGVRQNKSTAKELFGKACDNGHQAGCISYRALDEQGY